MELIRKENGNVELRDSGVLVWSMAQLPVEIKPIDKEERDHVKLFQNDGRVEYIYVDDLTETQIEPNAAVPFAGTVFDLADLLSADFFFEVVSGGGINSFYPSGYYVDFLPVFTSTVGRPYIQDNFFGTIVEIKSDITLEESFLSVTISGIGSGIAGIYKYNEDTTDWDLALNIGIFNLAVTGTQYLTYTPTQLNAGIYAYGFVLQAAATINSVNVNQQTLIFGRPSISNYLNRITFPKVYDGTLPSTISPTIQASATGNPLIYNKIV